MANSRRNSNALHQSPRHRFSHTHLKPTVKQQPLDHRPNAHHRHKNTPPQLSRLRPYRFTTTPPSQHALYTSRLCDMHRHRRMVHIPTNHYHSSLSHTHSTRHPRKLGMDSASLPDHVLRLPLCSSTLGYFRLYNNRPVCKRLCNGSMTPHSSTIHLPSPLS